MFTEDLDAFLNTSELAVSAVYDGATTVNVLFDAAYQSELGMAGTNPVATGKASDFPAASCVGKTLVVNGTTYTIRDRQPIDDGAMVALQLTSG